MAEGWARRLKGDLIEPFSAGTAAKGLDPLAVKAMAEAVVDISGHRSKAVADLQGMEFDYVVTVCSDADANCPFFPAKTRVLHRGFDDPPRLASGEIDIGEEDGPLQEGPRRDQGLRGRPPGSP